MATPRRIEAAPAAATGSAVRETSAWIGQGLAIVVRPARIVS
jgi:hypothetical protein